MSLLNIVVVTWWRQLQCQNDNDNGNDDDGKRITLLLLLLLLLLSLILLSSPSILLLLPLLLPPLPVPPPLLLLLITFINTITTTSGGSPEKLDMIFDILRLKQMVANLHMLFSNQCSNENRSILIQVSLKYVSKYSIGGKSALLQVMAWRQTGDSPWSDADEFVNAYIRQLASMT